MSSTSSVWFFFVSQTRAGSPSTQLPGPWLVTNDSHMHGSGKRASQGPHSYLEGPGAEELLQLQAIEPVSKSWDVATSQFCGGRGVGVCGPCPGIACMSVGSVPRACAAQMCQRDHGLRTHLSPVPISAAWQSVAWSHLPSKAFLHRGRNVCLGGCRCPMRSVSTRKQQALARADRLRKRYLCFILTLVCETNPRSL